MSSRWANPVNNNILRDLEDNVLASGSVEFFEANTSTPINVYSDAALSSSLGSYIDADAFGLLPDFHLAAGTQVKVQAYDAIGGSGGAGSLKWTRDYVFSLDSSTDTRLDVLESAVAAIQAGYGNAIINGGMRVESETGSVTLSTSYQEGQVADTYGKVANVTAGTFVRTADLDYETAYVAEFSGVSTNNAAATVDIQFRVGSLDAARFVDQQAAFACNVEHDVGSAVNYTITFAKPSTTADDFSSLTTISTSSATSVSSGAITQVTATVTDLGDCSKGIAVIVSAACGIVTTKSFKFGVAQLVEAATVSGFSEPPYRVTRAALRSTYPPGHIDGLRISSDADTDHDIQVAIGSARDATNTENMDLSSVITKQLDAAWAEGDDAGGLPSGVTLSGPEWLYFFLITKADGTADAGFDDNASATNLLSDATGYAYYRHIGSVRTNSSNNIDFVLYNPDIGVVDNIEYFTTTGANTFYWPPLVRRVTFDVVGAGGGGVGSGGTATAGGNSVVTYNSITTTAGGGTAASTTAANNIGGIVSGTYDIGADGGAGDNNGRGAQAGGGFGSGSSFSSIGTGAQGPGGGGGSNVDNSWGGSGGAWGRKTHDYVSGQDTASITVGAGGDGMTDADDGGDGVVIARW